MPTNRKHTGPEPQDCPVCRATQDALNARGAIPLDPGSLGTRHRTALRRAERSQALRNLGLVRVRGNMGGTYWE